MPDASGDPGAIDALREGWHSRLAALSSESELKSLTDEYLGRKSGLVSGLMKTLGSLPPDDRRAFGARVNELKEELERSLEAKRQSLQASRPPADAVDVTLPGRRPPLGRVHPLMRVRQEVEEIFVRMGYEILEG